MSLTFDYISIIRDYILSHPTDILFHRAYYFLIDYKTKEVIKCFDTDMALSAYTVLLDRSECYHRDYCDTFIPPHESDELYPINANDDTDELRIIEREALKKSKISKERFFVSDCETPYRYILMSYCIYGLKRNSGKLWFTDQEFAIYRLGEAKVRETEYIPKYDYISPLSTGSFNRRFWYEDDTTVSQVLKKLRYNINLLS